MNNLEIFKMSCSNCGSEKVNHELRRVKEEAKKLAIRKGTCVEIWKEFGHYKFAEQAPGNLKIIDTISPHE